MSLKSLTILIIVVFDSLNSSCIFFDLGSFKFIETVFEPSLNSGNLVSLVFVFINNFSAFLEKGLLYCKIIMSFFI